MQVEKISGSNIIKNNMERNKNGDFIPSWKKHRIQNIRKRKNAVGNAANENKEDDRIAWNDGRRVVELGVLAEGLSECSSEDCQRVLNLKNVVRERRVGLGSLLWIQCECGEVNQVMSGKTHRMENTHYPIFDVNTKVSEGMLCAGLTQTGVQRFLATVEVPPPTRKTLKVREREVGPVIEKVAAESCSSGQLLECILTDQGSSEGPTNLIGSYDMGWQRRSSGRAYNSRSGHGVLVGEVSGKVMAYGSRIVNCKQCEVNVRTGKEKKHDCRINWDGSSKAMEADLAVELIKSVNNSEYRVGTIISDEDATTMSKVRTAVDYEVSKRSDLNHIKKTLGTSLYGMQNVHKVLQSKVITYIQKCFSWCLAQNKGNADATKRAINNIVPHIFGDHSDCGEWCRFKTDPTHTYKSLPYGRCLTGDDLRRKLTAIFSVYANNAEKLCFISSSNSNESFNQMVASKAPKYCHYSKSESLDFRIASSVCQKNVGETYVNSVDNKLGLPSSKVSERVALTRDKGFLKRKEREATKAFKKRRVELKAQRSNSTTQKEIREGTTYQSSVCLMPVGDTELVSIPPSTPVPPLKPISAEVIRAATCCVFDLETTSLFDDCDIVQISAVTIDGQHTFDRYVLPNKDISPHASNIHGFTKKGSRLFLNGALVHSVNIRQALENFSEWMTSLNDEIVLIGHNMRVFDAKRFLRHVTENQLGSILGKIVGFVDTLPLFKCRFPDDKSNTQSAVYERVVGGAYNAHNALDDVKALAKILQCIHVNHEILSKFSMTISAADQYYSFLENKKKNIATFQSLPNHVLSKGMIEKAAGSGLTVDHLHVVFTRSGENGLRSLFTEQFDGKPRVTKKKKILDAVVQYFKTLPSAK